MGLDNKDDIDKIKSKVSAYKTVVQNKESELKKKKNEVKEKITNKKSDIQKKLKDLKEKAKKRPIEEISLYKQLIELYKTTVGNAKKNINKKKEKLSSVKTTRVLGDVFLMATENTKGQMAEILIECITETLGCSEEQSYQDMINIPIYIKLKHIDLFKILKTGPEDQYGRFYYEKSTTENGQIPYSMNRELYNRLISNQSFVQQYGQSYIGASGQQLFDMQYVNQYTNPLTNVTEYDDFIKITLLNQSLNRTKVSDFLRDYYASIEIFNLDSIIQAVISHLLSAIEFGMNKPVDELSDLEKFIKFVKRIMGICSDPSKKIDISGSAKLSDLDLIDDSFFDISPQELLEIDFKNELTINGLVTFEDCDTVNLPVNVGAAVQLMDDVIKENKAQEKVNKFFEGIEDISNDPRWQQLLGPNLDINETLLLEFLYNLPMCLIRAILTPKVMLGFMIMIKSIISNGVGFINELFENMTEFFKKFKKFLVCFLRKIIAIFIEQIFDLIKKNIKILVETILLDIAKEAKNKQIAMYANIIYILFVIGQAVVDYRNCKSVLDELLKLLNLGLSQLNLGLPSFALAGAQFLGGVSDTRSYANVVENLQNAGLPTDDNPDGSPNLMNLFTKSKINGMNKEQAENGKTEVYLPPLKVVTPSGVGTTLPGKTSGKSY
jgi:hypothetical protein